MRNCLLILSVAVLAMMTVACEKSGKDTPDPGTGSGDDSTATEVPVLTLTSDSEMRIGYEGGQLSITYTVDNPAADGRVYASSENTEWIRDYDCSVDGTVSFNVDANDGEDREAVVTVEYSYADKSDEFEVKVIQSGNGDSYDYNVEIATVSGNYLGGENTISINTEMEYELHLSDASGAYNYIFHLYSARPEDPEHPAPPAGKYTLDTQGLTEKGTVNSTHSVFYTDNESSAIGFEDAEIRISKEGEDYAYLIYLTDVEGKTHKVTYNGPVALVNQYQTYLSTLEDDVELNIEDGSAVVSVYYFGSMNYEGVSQWSISLYPAENAQWCYQIHLLLPQDNTFDDGIAPGVYEVNASRSANTVVAGWLGSDDSINGAWAYNIYYNEDLPRGPMTGGTVSIEVDGEGVYTFTVDCTDDNTDIPHTVTGVISGVPDLNNPFGL